jgi:transposase
MTAQITLPLDLPNVQVLHPELTATGDFVITVESTLTSTQCRRCGRDIRGFHGYDEEIRLRHLPILSHRVSICIRPKRYRCPYCADKPTTTQQVAWYTPKSAHTHAYDRSLLLQLINSTPQDVSLKEEGGYDAIVGSVDRHIAAHGDCTAYARLDVLGLDEIALQKGRSAWVVVVTARQADGRVHVLGVLPDRTTQAVQQFLASIPTRLQRTVTTVCTDMDEGYITAAKAVLGAAVVVVDRFHVAKQYRDCADTVRKRETKRLKKTLPKEDYAQLKGAMHAFRKNSADLTDHDAEILDRLFGHSPILKDAYTLREDLTAIFEQDLTKGQATIKIRAWQARVRASGLTCFDRFLDTLDERLDESTNYFHRRLTSGFEEGLNTTIKVLKRRCYGIYNLRRLFQRLFLAREGYALFGRGSPVPLHI